MPFLFVVAMAIVMFLLGAGLFWAGAWEPEGVLHGSLSDNLWRTSQGHTLSHHHSPLPVGPHIVFIKQLKRKFKIIGLFAMMGGCAGRITRRTMASRPRSRRSWRSSSPLSRESWLAPTAQGYCATRATRPAIHCRTPTFKHQPPLPPLTAPRYCATRATRPAIHCRTPTFKHQPPLPPLTAPRYRAHRLGGRFPRER